MRKTGQTVLLKGNFIMFYFVRRGVVDKLFALYPEVPGVPGSTSLSDETLTRDPVSETF